MRFGAFVITFNRPLILKKTLHLILNQTWPPELILIVDNGNSKDTERAIQAFSNHGVLYHPMEQNFGPAGASAYALQWLTEQGYDLMYWGDDDDPPQSPDIFQQLLKIVDGAEPSIGGVGAVGSLWNWEKGEFNRLPDQTLRGILDVDVIAGNSQLILRGQAIQSVGLPDACLFFGFEEAEYCLRIRRAGYRLLVDGDQMRECRAKAGRLNLNRVRSPLPRFSRGSIWRQYYSTRNYIFAMYRTFQRPDLARRETFKAFIRISASWGRGPKYGASFTTLQLRGILDGYRGRMGCTVMPSPKY
jgi:glycosyltransferase involved in cell wall biosynthesis